MKIKCTHCENEWDTSSSYKFVSCPNCLLKTENNAVVGIQNANKEVLEGGIKEDENKS